MSDEIKPCPFCGGKAIIRFGPWFKIGPERDEKQNADYFWPTCALESGCPGITDEQDEQGGVSCECSTEAEAIEAWNRRADLHASKEFRDREWIIGRIQEKIGKLEAVGTDRSDRDSGYRLALLWLNELMTTKVSAVSAPKEPT